MVKKIPNRICMTEKTKITPMIKQFLNIKNQHPDKLLLFRMGDFYETFFDDAKTASKVLGITLPLRKFFILTAITPPCRPVLENWFQTTRNGSLSSEIFVPILSSVISYIFGKIKIWKILSQFFGRLVNPFSWLLKAVWLSKSAKFEIFFDKKFQET